MPVVNYQSREITCKIVYYGPGRSGKTTNLQHVYSQLPEDRKGKMVSLATETDRTLFFDFLPLDLGSISGFSTRFQLYTVPGQVYYQATRRLVLQGVDGVVFVADSQRRQMAENVESLQDLHANLAELGFDPRSIPLVMQYNKRDLPENEITPIAELERVLNFRDVPAFSSVAMNGTGVFETLRAIASRVLARLSSAPAVAGAQQ
jgi:mutual gliding-motility protein MglA